MSSDASVAGSARTNNFELLRLILASAVLAYHDGFALRDYGHWVDASAFATSDQIHTGLLAVAAFFMVSGHLICQSWLRGPSPGTYLSKRALRIGPGYLVAVLVSGIVFAPLIAPGTGIFGGLSVLRVLGRALLLQIDFPDPFLQFNACLWTIRYEWVAYMVLMGLGLIGVIERPRLMIGVWLLCLVLLFAQQVLHMRIPGARLAFLVGYPGNWPLLMSCFLAGALAQVLHGRVRYTTLGACVAFAGLVAGALVMPRLHLFQLAVPTCGAYFLFWFAYVANPPAWMRPKLDLSYGVYLYGFPVQVSIAKHWGPQLTPSLLFVIAMPITLVIAYLSWKLVESPALKLKPSRRLAPAG